MIPGVRFEEVGCQLAELAYSSVVVSKTASKFMNT